MQAIATRKRKRIAEGGIVTYKAEVAGTSLKRGVHVRTLPWVSPPIPESNGRVRTRAGELVRIANDDKFAFAAYIDFLPPPLGMRGNIYHSVKTTIHYIIRGTIKAVYYDLDSGAVRRETLRTGHVVEIPPRWAHAYYALEYSQAIEMADRPYDPHDSIPYDLSGYFQADLDEFVGAGRPAKF
jgi:hypothetical protein